MWDSQKEGIVEKPFFQVDPQRGRLQTFEEDTRIVGGCAIQVGPQRCVRDENLPPVATYVSKSDEIFARTAVKSNERQDLRWNAIDGYERVLCRPDEAQHS